MDIKVSSGGYEVIKDGVIVANAGDDITFRFADLEFLFKIIEVNDFPPGGWPDDFTVSDDKKHVKFPIRVSMQLLSSIFSSRIEFATYEESGKKKKLCFSYVINGYNGGDVKIYCLRYTWFSKDIQF